jgi:hypothetical protein
VELSSALRKTTIYGIIFILLGESSIGAALISSSAV